MRFKLLVSYAYFKNEDLAEYHRIAEAHGNQLQLFIDSGAVTAESLGWTINLQDYTDWLRDHRKLITTYANLDVIRDVKQTHENQLFMESRGLKPVPVFHRGEPWSVLDQLAASYRYIAVGGAVPDSRTNQETQLGRWLVGVFRRAPGVGIHGFGITRQKLLNSFPFYSVDASSWQLGAQYGALRIWDRRAGRMRVVSQHQHSMLNHIRLVRDYDEDPKLLAGTRQDGYHYSMALRIGIHSFRAYEVWLRQRHGLIKVPRLRPGLHLYAATASTNHVRSTLALEKQPSWLEGAADV